MDDAIENVKQAKASFERILDNRKYTEIIRDDRHLNVLLDMIQKKKHHRILDVGTGTGYLAFPLAKVYPDSIVYGLDIAGNIVAKNNELAKQYGINNIEFKTFDGINYPFEEETFDIIVTRFAFHHFPNIVDTIQQFKKMLVKGGTILISDPMKNELDKNEIIDDFMKIKKDGHIKFYSGSELDDLFESNGFVKEQQVITSMKFPFAKRDEYVEVYNKTTATERGFYDISNENGIVWIKQIAVGNTIFIKNKDK